eukprot:1140640-Pelagomonas_calceolata.AAC.2
MSSRLAGAPMEEETCTFLLQLSCPCRQLARFVVVADKERDAACWLRSWALAHGIRSSEHPCVPCVDDPCHSQSVGQQEGTSQLDSSHWEVYLFRDAVGCVLWARKLARRHFLSILLQCDLKEARTH